ncbi:glycosyltransferase family 2 protein [Thermococcus sp. 5-4]|uniref:glycosyltransferase family 2 protein n=1 Tax=Thermococcus sp. 5-4 TaxID=2008440 RepID=UPI000B499D1A|nr:glycosyltransferase family 2 protein [Thermococcus sp. 5-4]ASA78638.1 glycosyl transferase family 2 [Thermococcus sp. 5-4]
MKSPRVSIIILNWNGWKDTIECLESLYRITYSNYDVIVVDNGSKDESIQKIKEYAKGDIKVSSKFFTYNPYNKPIRIFEVSENEARDGKFNRPLYEKYDVNKRLILIKNKNNYGFTGGNNVGLQFALSVLNPDYVLFLNNDTVVDKEFLTELIKVAESDEKIGIVGSKIYYYDYKGRSDIVWALGGGGVDLKTGRAWHYGISAQDKKVYKDTNKIGYITGCSMLVKKDILIRLHGFDDAFFSYYEDVDISLRAKSLGYRLSYALSSKVWHKVGATSGGDSVPFIVYIKARNHVLLVKTHGNSLNLILAVIWLLTYKHARRFINFVFLQRNPRLLIHYYNGIKEGLLRY